LEIPRVDADEPAMIRAALDGSVMLHELVGDLAMIRDCSDDPAGIGDFSDTMVKGREALCGSEKLVGV
jgi:hypothetical protein